MAQLKQIMGAEALARVAPLFDGCDETLVWTALQGLMGRVWALDGAPEPYACAVTVCGDFVFFAGEADAALVRAYHEREGDRFAILTPQNDAWAALLAAEYGEKGYFADRYAICKDANQFDRAKLEAIARTLPEGVTLSPIDGELYRRCLATGWACDFCSQFPSEADFAAHGLGVVALKDGELVGGASSYVYYQGGIEIEVDTREDWRRKGVAAACSARLILACLDRGLYPSWDAANRMSVGLAQKLGYREKGAYRVLMANEK